MTDTELSLSETLAQAISKANWITEADVAQIAIAQTLARRIPELTDTRELLEAMKTFSTLIRDLGLTPAGRKERSFEVDSEVNPLDVIIAKREARPRKATPSDTKKPKAGKQSKRDSGFS